MDIPRIQEALPDNMPRSWQQAVNRNDNRLSRTTRSAGSVAVHNKPYMSCGASDDVEVLYNIGQSYIGQAERSVKPHW